MIKFVLDDFSRTYVKLAKPRLFDEDDKHAFITLYHTLKEVTEVMSIFCPFISSFLYSKLGEKKDVLLADFPEINDDQINSALEERMNKSLDLIQDVLSIREKLKLTVKRPIRSLALVGITQQNIIEDILMKMTNVLNLNYALPEEEYSTSINTKYLSARYKSHEVTQIIGKFLELTKGTIIRNISKGMSFSIDGKEYKLGWQDIELKALLPDREVLDGRLAKIV